MTHYNPYPRRQKRKERKFPIKEWEKAKRKRKEIPNQRVGERKKKRKKIPNQRMGESKKEGSSWSKETRRNVQRGLWTRQYLNSTELSPNEQEEGKETTT